MDNKINKTEEAISGQIRWFAEFFCCSPAEMIECYELIQNFRGYSAPLKPKKLKLNLDVSICRS